jgi:hypothetical protein
LDNEGWEGCDVTSSLSKRRPTAESNMPFLPEIASSNKRSNRERIGLSLSDKDPYAQLGVSYTINGVKWVGCKAESVRHDTPKTTVLNPQWRCSPNPSIAHFPALF